VKKRAINAAIDYVTRSLLTRLSGNELNAFVLKAQRFRASNEAKRQYIKDRVRGIEHEASEHVVGLVTEMALYQHHTR
jgi:hypothetical protein